MTLLAVICKGLLNFAGDIAVPCVKTLSESLALVNESGRLILNIRSCTLSLLHRAGEKSLASCAAQSSTVASGS